jgi:hypothetical protein
MSPFFLFCNSYVVKEPHFIAVYAWQIRYSNSDKPHNQAFNKHLRHLRIAGMRLERYLPYIGIITLNKLSYLLSKPCNKVRIKETA